MNAPRMASLVAALAVTTSACGGYVADTSIVPGDRVRVTAPSMNLRKGVGTVVALETDTLVVDTEERADALEVPLADVTRLQVHRGQKSGAGKGALTGALVGAPIGALLGILGCEFAKGEDATTDCSTAVAAVGAALVVGGVGAGIGALIGLASSGDRWETVPLEDIRVGVSPVTPDGVAVSVAFPLRL